MAIAREHQCKGCGLLVQPGYPRCPRCTMPLPENRKRSETVAGATALGQESQTSLWIGIGALVLVIAVVAYAAMGDDKRPAPAASEIAEEDDETEEFESPTVAPPSESGEVGITIDEMPESESEQRSQALARFEQGLRESRLWSTVSAQGNTLNLVSGTCSDEGMRPTIGRFSSALSDVGFSKIRCVEKHGALVFEQGL